jgi:hypothetical protein
VKRKYYFKCKKSFVYTIYLALLFQLSCIFSLLGQPVLHYSIQSNSIYASSELAPLWLHSNNFGTINNFGHGELALSSNITYTSDFIKKSTIQLGIEGNVKNEWTKSSLLQAYAAIDYKKMSLIIGKKNIDFLYDKGQESPFMNYQNIRPFPYIAFGFFEYTALPFTREYVTFKAAFVQGILNDDREEGIQDPLFHFKNLYVSTGKLPVNLFVGMNHSVVFGGTMQDGTKIPVDLISTYLARQGSERVGEVLPTEEINRPGEHLGLVEIGIVRQSKNKNFALAVGQPYTDSEGDDPFINKDKTVRLQYYVNNKSLFSSITYEFASLKYQSGPGLDLTNYQFIDDYSAYLREEFGLDIQVTDWPEFFNLLVDLINHGYATAGRDNYFNNGIYPLSSFYDGHFMGYPFAHSKWQIAHFKDIDNFDYQVVGNNRVVAHHFSLKGWVNKRLSYQTRCSFSKNYGTYAGVDYTTFEQLDGYYFKDGKNQNYYSLTLNYQLHKMPLGISLSLGYDMGELYDAFGMLFSLKYKGQILTFDD